MIVTETHEVKIITSLLWEAWDVFGGAGGGRMGCICERHDMFQSCKETNYLVGVKKLERGYQLIDSV